MNKTERIARLILSKITLHPEEAKRKGIEDAKQFCDDPTWVRNIQKDYDRFCDAEGAELSKGDFKLYQKTALEELKKRGKIFASKSNSIEREPLTIAKSLLAGDVEVKTFYKGTFYGQRQNIEVEIHKKEDFNWECIEISYPPFLCHDWIQNAKEKDAYLRKVNTWLIEIEKFKKGVIEMKKYLEKE